MLEEGIKTERETDERREIMRRAGVDGDKKKAEGGVKLIGKSHKKEREHVRERTEKTESISYVIMSHCASHLTSA